MFLQMENTEIKGNRIETAGVHDPRSRGFGGGTVSRDRLMHPAGLAREIDIVRARFRTLLYQFVTVELVGADRGDDDASGRHHRGD